IGPKLKFLLDNLVLAGGAGLSGVGLIRTQRLTGGSLEGLAVIGMLVACFFILAALRVRGLYVGAIYERLCTHAISLSDFQQALGAPTPEQIAELQGFIRQGDDKVREFAAAALGKLAPDAFASMLPELTASEDAMLRRLAFQMSPPDVISADQLRGANDAQHRAAAVWAASFVGDHKTVASALADPEPRVRLEGLRSFAKMKADVPGSAAALIACMRDPERDVKRAALREATRW